MAAGLLEPPPRDFTAARDLEPERARRAIRDGRPGTAMKPFARVLTEAEIGALAHYVSEAFAACDGGWPAYHTAANGWPDHRERYGAAYPYVLGDLPVEAPRSDGARAADAGLRLFTETCAICHDPAARRQVAEAADDEHDEEYGYGYGSEHDEPPRIPGLTPEQARGEALYQANCAICHAADGTGRNWIGRFLQPQPTDFTDPAIFGGKDEAALRRAILDGLPGTSMPAFRSALTAADAAAITAYLKRAFAPR